MAGSHTAGNFKKAGLCCLFGSACVLTPCFLRTSTALKKSNKDIKNLRTLWEGLLFVLFLHIVGTLVATIFLWTNWTQIESDGNFSMTGVQIRQTDGSLFGTTKAIHAIPSQKMYDAASARHYYDLFGYNAQGTTYTPLSVMFDQPLEIFEKEEGRLQATIDDELWCVAHNRNVMSNGVAQAVLMDCDDIPSENQIEWVYESSMFKLKDDKNVALSFGGNCDNTGGATCKVVLGSTHQLVFSNTTIEESVEFWHVLCGALALLSCVIGICLFVWLLLGLKTLKQHEKENKVEKSSNHSRVHPAEQQQPQTPAKDEAKTDVEQGSKKKDLDNEGEDSRSQLGEEEKPEEAVAVQAAEGEQAPEEVVMHEGVNADEIVDTKTNSAEEEARRAAEEAERLAKEEADRAEEEARRLAEAAAAAEAEEERLKEEARKAAEEQDRLEEEAKRLAEEAERKNTEAARLAAEEAARAAEEAERAEEEAKRLAEEAEKKADLLEDKAEAAEDAAELAQKDYEETKEHAMDHVAAPDDRKNVARGSIFVEGEGNPLAEIAPAGVLFSDGGFAPGERVRIHSCKKRSQYNGIHGHLMYFDGEKGKWRLKQDDFTEKILFVNPNNLRHMWDPTE